MEVERLSNGTFAPGHHRIPGAGRAKNTPNRFPAKVYNDVISRLEARDFSVVDECIKLFRSRKTSNDHRVRILAILASVSFPKMLAISAKTRVTHGIDRETLLRLQSNPQFARAMEAATFALEDAKVRGLLPAPAPSGANPDALPILDAEPCDEPGEPRVTGLAL